jgi:hypothetical protein
MAAEPIQTGKTDELLAKLIETMQDFFILYALESGVPGGKIRSLLRVDQRRINNVSKLRPKKHRTNDVEK